MKILQLSDLHIGLKLYHYDLQEDQRHIFRQIAEYARQEEPDAIVIAGDIYDKAIPSAEAVELFDYFINLLTEAVPTATIMMISGNHDSAGRINVFRNILAKRNIYMIGVPPMREEEHIEKVVLQDDYGNVNFYLLPFVKPTMVKMITGVDENGNNLSYDESMKRLIEREEIDHTERNIFVSHQFYLPEGKSAEELESERADSEIKTVGNIDQISAAVLSPFDYVALGHIHKPMTVGKEHICYSGTPIACSVSEAGQEKSVLCIEIKEKKDLKICKLPLEPLRKVRVLEGSYEEILAEPESEDYISIVLTDTKGLEEMDVQDRLKSRFPKLLEIRRRQERKANYSQSIALEKEMNPFELCLAMLKDGCDEEEVEILRDVINVVKGVE